METMSLITVNNTNYCKQSWLGQFMLLLWMSQRNGSLVDESVPIQDSDNLHRVNKSNLWR